MTSRKHYSILCTLHCLAALLVLANPALANPETVRFKWDGNYPHNTPALWDKGRAPSDAKNIAAGWTTYFQAGAPEEGYRVRTAGELKGLLYRVSKNPTPFVIWMHGCTGLPPVVLDWTRELAQILNKLGYGLLVLDSHTTRFVRKTCGAPSTHWALRRADDAGTALDYLVERKIAKPDQVYVMGQSNGGNAALLAVSDYMRDRRNRFAAAFPQEPHCGLMNYTNMAFYTPVFLLLAEQDEANPIKHCLELTKKSHKWPMQTTVIKDAFHGYTFKGPNRVAVHDTVRWRAGHDPRGTKVTMDLIRAFFADPKIQRTIDYK